MRFYNNNPSGRILNRFSKDLGYIDEYIPPVLFDVIEVGLMLIGALFLSFIVDPWLIIPSAVLMILFYFFRVVYIKTSRSVKRIEGISKEHFSYFFILLLLYCFHYFVACFFVLLANFADFLKICSALM